MASLFGVDRATIAYHISQIYESGELQREATCRKTQQVQLEGERDVERAPLFYNLDVIIAVGYRVNSYQATQFRIWATSVLKEFVIKGYSEYEKFKVIQDRSYISDFDRFNNGNDDDTPLLPFDLDLKEE